MIEFVTVENTAGFRGNPIAEQHKLRYRCVIERQDWDVPCYNGLEYDEYDNPVAKYLIYRDENGIARGLSRFYPTNQPYMLEQTFPHFISKIPLPKTDSIWEGSRYCIDHNISAKERHTIIKELALGYLEMGLYAKIDGIVGLTYPSLWRSLFINMGWPIEFIGEVTKLECGRRAQAAWLPVSQEILNNVRDVTGIHQSVLYLGDNYENENRTAA